MNMTYKQIILLIISSVLSFSAWAAKGSFTYGLVKIEPVVTAEREQRFYPTAHTKDTLLYGGRLLIGPNYFLLESEYLMGNDTESFPEENKKVRTDSERMKLGLRAQLTLGRFFSWFLRGGMQGKKSTQKVTDTDTDSTETSKSAYYIDPYVGTGFRFQLLDNISATGDLTAVFTDRPEKGDRDYQASLGFSLAI